VRREFQDFRREFRDLKRDFHDLKRDFHDFRVGVNARMETFATKEELRAGLEAVRSDLAEGFAEMRAYVEASVISSEERLRTHFDVVAESFRSEFRNLYDWTHTNISGVATRVDSLETTHGARLESLDLRVTRLETDSKPPARPGRRRR
jgi:hypothetical protein